MICFRSPIHRHLWRVRVCMFFALCRTARSQIYSIWIIICSQNQSQYWNFGCKNERNSMRRENNFRIFCTSQQQIGCRRIEHHQTSSSNPKPGRFGDYMCDSPWTLLESATQAMKSRQGDNVEFVLWTGYAPIFIYTNSFHVNCEWERERERRHRNTVGVCKAKQSYFSLWQIAARHSNVLRWPFAWHAFTHTTVCLCCVYVYLQNPKRWIVACRSKVHKIQFTFSCRSYIFYRYTYDNSTGTYLLRTTHSHTHS